MSNIQKIIVTKTLIKYQRKLFILMVMYSLLSYSCTKACTEWKLTKESSQISFNIPDEKCHGVIKDFETNIKFSPDNLQGSKITAKITSNAIKSEVPQQTSVILSSEILDSSQYPFITFESTQFEKSNAKYVVSGLLTLKQITHPIKLDFSFSTQGDQALFNGKATIILEDYSIHITPQSNKKTSANFEINLLTTKK